MKTITSEFKEALKNHGREMSVIISYEINGIEVDLTNDDIISATYNIEGGILKSIMKELEFTSKTAIATGTKLHFQFGLKVENDFEYIDYGYFYIKEREQHREDKTYSYKCMDKMLYAMVNYPADGIIEITPGVNETLNGYIYTLASYLGMTFKNDGEDYTNKDLVISADYWVSSNNRYTIRDALDQVAEAVGGNIIVNTNEELEIIYPNETNEIINGDYLCDINIQIEKMYGVINSITSTRADGTDNVNVQDSASVETSGETRLTIVENLLLADDNRLTYLQNILDRVDGLRYAILDIDTFGVPFLEVGDMYDLKLGSSLQPRVGLHPRVGLTPQQGRFKCLMLSSTLKIQGGGFTHQIFTEAPMIETLDFVNSNANLMTDKQTQIIVDKQMKEITISADQISLEGYTTINDGFSVDLEGNMVANSGKISKFDIGSGGLIFPIYAPYDYTSQDLTIVSNIISQGLTPTPEQLERYDLTGDGEIKANDYIAIKWYVNYGITTTNPGTFEIIPPTTPSLLTAYTGYKDGYGNQIAGFNFRKAQFDSINLGDENDYVYATGGLLQVGYNNKEKFEIDTNNGYLSFGEEITADPSTIKGRINLNTGRISTSGNFLCNGKIEGAFNFTDDKKVFINRYGFHFQDEPTAGSYAMYTHNLCVVNGPTYATGFINYSQEDRKKNFEKLENGLNIIKDTDIYTYNFKNEEDNDKKHIGFVIGDKYKYSKELTNKDNTGVDAYAMVSVCFKAIQEQQKMIEDLQNQINKLKEKESE